MDAVDSTIGYWRASTEHAGRQASCAYPSGVEIFHQGHVLHEVFYVLTGSVKLTQLDGHGGESIVDLVCAGEWLGTAAVIANRPSPVSAVARLAVTLTRCPAATFRHLLQDDPKMSQQIHIAHAIGLCRQTSRIGQLCSLSSRDRLRSALSLFASAAPSPGCKVQFRLPLQQWELAEFIGISPEHLSRLLKDLEQEGLIRRTNGWIVVRELQALCDAV